MNEQRTAVGPIVETIVDECTQGHTWHPTIIIGYFQCAKCHTLAACRICAPKLRGHPLVGVCQQHLHLRTPETKQEVLA